MFYHLTQLAEERDNCIGVSGGKLLIASSVFSIGFAVDFGSRGVDVAETKCQQHFAETGNLTDLK